LGDIELKLNLSQFPNNSIEYKKVAKSSGLLQKKEEALLDITKEIVKKLDVQFNKTFKTSFSQTHADLLEIGYANPSEIKQTQKLIIKNTISEIENQWKATSVER
jgi:hypothetical protein